jgi:predicted RNA binding protein YcfA (HicA-like mRNA interferase family)
MAAIAVLEKNGQREMPDVGRHIEHKDSDMAELALVPGDDRRAKGPGTIL